MLHASQHENSLDRKPGAKAHIKFHPPMYRFSSLSSLFPLNAFLLDNVEGNI